MEDFFDVLMKEYASEFDEFFSSNQDAENYDVLTKISKEISIDEEYILFGALNKWTKKLGLRDSLC